MIGLFAPLALAVALLVAAAGSAHGQELESLRYAPDVTADFGAAVIAGGAVASDDLNGTVAAFAIAGLPAAARIAALHRFDGGDLLLALDSTIALPGAGAVEPRDVVRFSNATQTFSVEVRGADVGIPRGARIDALAAGATLLLSLDVSVGAFDDADVLALDGDQLTLFLDLSAIGIAPALDLDGLDIAASQTTLFLSFDGTGAVDGVPFDDEDVISYDLAGQTWAPLYDGSAAAPPWPHGADLIALGVVLAPTPTATPTSTPPPPTSSATPSVTDTPSATATVATATATVTQPEATRTASATPTPPAPTSTATATAPEATRTASATATPPESTRTATATAPEATRSATATPPAPTHTPPTIVVDPTRTSSPTATATGSAPPASPTATASSPVGATATASATATPTGTLPCPGDCDGSGEVTINELILMVNIALGNTPVSSCPAGDLNDDGVVAINELITAVGSAINGCPP